jgi:hypothetical protein
LGWTLRDGSIADVSAKIMTGSTQCVEPGLLGISSLEILQNSTFFQMEVSQ